MTTYTAEAAETRRDEDGFDGRREATPDVEVGPNHESWWEILNQAMRATE
jgi:hypothetical protein